MRVARMSNTIPRRSDAPPERTTRHPRLRLRQALGCELTQLNPSQLILGAIAADWLPLFRANCTRVDDR